MFILFIYSVCVSACVCDLFACLFAYSTVLCLPMLPFCSKLVYVCTYVGLYVGPPVCFCIFVFTIQCECLCINCQTSRALQQSQTIFKIFLSKKKVFYQMLALGSLNPTIKPNKVVYHSVHCLLHLHVLFYQAK